MVTHCHVSNNIDSLFRMVISTKNSETAKTISTLAHNLNLIHYGKIIILDDAESCWCKHDLMQLKWQKRMEIQFIQCPPFEYWKNVYIQYRDWYAHNVAIHPETPSYQLDPKPLPHFCSLAKKNRESDTEFKTVHQTLQSMLKPA